jgi:arylsulfatase
VWLDGYNLMPHLKGEAKEWPRKEFMYWSDDGDLMAMRYENWKAVFAEQRAEGFQVWSEPLVKLRVPLLFNLRSDPLEKALHESEYYHDWLIRRVFLLVPAQAFVARWISSFKEFPPRQKPASFSIDEVMVKLEAGITKNRWAAACELWVWRTSLVSAGTCGSRPREAPGSRARPLPSPPRPSCEEA